MTLELQTWFLLGASLAAVLGAGWDVRSGRIPNRLTYAAVLAGLLLHGLTQGAAGWLQALGGMLLGGGMLLPVYLLGGMGGGDVKLMAAVGALAGGGLALREVVATALAGAAIALLLVLWRGRLLATLRNTGQLLAWLARRRLAPHERLNLTNAALLRLPYGVAMALGAGWVLGTALWRG